MQSVDDILRGIFIYVFRISLGVFTSIVCFSSDLFPIAH